MEATEQPLEAAEGKGESSGDGVQNQSKGSFRRWAIIGHAPRRLRRVSAAPNSQPHSVLLTGGEPGGRQVEAMAHVRLSTRKDAQHTIMWDEPLQLPLQVDGLPAKLVPGHLNLYRFPKVYFNHLRKGKAIVPDRGALFVLERLVLMLLADETLINGDCCCARAHTARPHRAPALRARTAHGAPGSRARIACPRHTPRASRAMG